MPAVSGLGPELQAVVRGMLVKGKPDFLPLTEEAEERLASAKKQKEDAETKAAEEEEKSAEKETEEEKKGEFLGSLFFPLFFPASLQSILRPFSFGFSFRINRLPILTMDGAVFKHVADWSLEWLRNPVANLVWITRDV